MPLDSQRVIQAMGSGLAMVCATCERYWRSVDRGGQSCGEVSCGGPLAGGDFPRYLGELPDFQRWCFACGATSSYLIRFEGVKPVGVCKQHLRLFHDLKPISSEVFWVWKDGKERCLDHILEAPKPTLLQSIILDQLEWSK